MSAHVSPSGHAARRTIRTVPIAVLFALTAVVAWAQAPAGKRPASDEHWVPTWGTAQQLIRTAVPPSPTAGRGTATVPPAANAPATPPSNPAPQPAAPTGAAPQGTAPPAGATGSQAPAVFRVTTLTNQTVRM